MTFKDFLKVTEAREVNEFWDSINLVQQEAIDQNWKYSLERNGKVVPFKWFIKSLSKHKNIEVDFGSNSENRDSFAEKFGFSIREDLVFNKEDLKRFTKWYENQVGNKELFQFFIDHAGDVISSYNIHPYKVRMAITQGNEAMFIVGMRAVLSYKNDKIGFIVRTEDLPEIMELYHLEKDYDFKGGNGVSFVYSQPNFLIDNSIKYLIEKNSEAINGEYIAVKDSPRSRWNSGANSTNFTLKKLMFGKDNVQDFLQISNSKIMDYFDVDAILELSYKRNNKIETETFQKLTYLFQLLEKSTGFRLPTPTEFGITRKEIILDSGFEFKFKHEDFFLICGFFDDDSSQEANPLFFKVKIESLHGNVADEIELNEIYGHSYTANEFPQNWNDLVNDLTPKLKELLQLSQNEKLIPQEDQKIEMKYPLNQILFGSPGTGKTYNTKRLAVEIIEGRKFSNSKEDRDEILKLYDRYIENKQIRFTTFHQSLSYEDFIEGIKPKTKNERVYYEIEDGIFLKSCSQAKDSWINSKSQNVGQLPFDDAFEMLKDEWEEDNEIKFPLKKEGSEYTVLQFGDKSIRFKKSSGGTGHTLSINTLKEIYYKQRDFPIKGVGIYYPALIDKLRSYSFPSYTKQPLKNFVFIIDEINRGNVSSIFGELITLVEDDKRFGMKEEIQVTLPYSGDSFSVPANLYIIGTMNTADRSVEALDTALRRRFSFVEMKSDPFVLRNLENGGMIENGIDLVKMLEIINKRIEILIDKDHQIGHSYFINVNNLSELKYTFKNKIVPLLEEYFYGDLGKIGLVLGERFIEIQDVKQNKGILSNFKAYEDVDFLTDKKLFNVRNTDYLNPIDFMSIYETVQEYQVNE